ncbi:MAG: hypothetical protein NTZ43_13655 [Gemmatimonadetes bacterium]|nr:hypothetical protein [Gemmatimonadota bacterium]
MTKRQHIARIKTLMKRLEKGDTVSNKMLSTVLSVKQIDEMKQSWQKEKAARRETKPKHIIRYQKLLRIAQFLEGRYERMHALKQGTDEKRIRMNEKCEEAYEAALEHIREDFSRYSDWLDRDPPEEQPCADNMPRVIGSNSFYCTEMVKRGTMTKRDVKIYALNNALEVLNPPVMYQIKDQILATRSSFLTRAKPDFSQIKF